MLNFKLFLFIFYSIIIIKYKYILYINIILIALISKIIFKEDISFGSFIGIIIIITGIFIMYYYEK